MATKSPQMARHQKLFRNGGSQAVRIPGEMKFDSDEVILRREGERLIIEPKVKSICDLSKKMGRPLDWEWEAPDSPVQPENFY